MVIDDLLHNRYRIVDKLGFGGYSTVWLAQDETSQRFVAVKVGISGSSSSRREAAILQHLFGSTARSQNQGLDAAAKVTADYALPRILDTFDVSGSNGIHTCYTLTPCQGSLKEASFSRLFTVQVARALAARLTRAVAYIHSRGIVHGGLFLYSINRKLRLELMKNPNLHLRNLLLKLPPTFNEFSVREFREQFGDPESIPITRIDKLPLSTSAPAQAIVPLYLGKKAQEFNLVDAQGLILSDFGEAFFPATEQRRGRDCNIPLAKRAPEALFEPNELMSYPSDIWSLGTAIWEILGMKFIFSESEPHDELVAQQIDVLGLEVFPESWKRQWERPGKESKHDIIPRQPTGDRERWPPLETAFEEFVQRYRRKRKWAGTFGVEETQAILDLMRGMLRYRPEERLTIDQVLRSDWMVKWALPQLKETDSV